MPKGLPENEGPAVKMEPALKAIDPGSAPVNRWAVVAVDENFTFPLMVAVAVVAIAMVIALIVLKFNEHPAGMYRSGPAAPVMVRVTGELL